MRTIAKTGLLTASLVVTVISGAPVLAFGAANSRANAQATQTTTVDSTTPSSRAADKKAAIQTKLVDAKLKSCQNREKAVNNIMSRISDRGQKQLDLFSSIATKTETFYTSKGKTLSNYDTLVADVTAKKNAAQTEVDAVKANSITFKCDGADPKDAVATFKESLKAEIAALKDYKTAVKNLIVGVKSAQGSAMSAENSTRSNQ